MRFMRLDVIQSILEVGVLPLYFHADLDISIKLAAACSEGGAKAVEITNRGDGALAIFTEMVKHFAKSDPSLIFGAGSIVDAPTAAMYLAAGANFVVGPNFNVEIAELCNRRKVLYVPGTATATEIATAEEYGAEICKVFPGETVGGPAFIKAVMAPCPWHRLMPTSGVDASEAGISAWIGAGAAAVGLGSKLFTTDAVANKDYDAIADKLGECIGWVRKAREKK